MWRVRTWVGLAVVVAGLALVVACSDDGPDAVTAGKALGAKETTVSSAVGMECRTDTSPTGTDEPEADPPPPGEGEDLAELPELPPPTIPGNVSPPTTVADDEQGPIEGDPVDVLNPDGPTIPALGGFRVDPPDHGCVDFAFHMEDYSRVRIKTWGDDGIRTTVQVWSPSGEKLAQWETGEPQTYEGYAWDDEGLPEVGTYVIRTIHRGGSHNSFVIIVYAD